MRDRVVMCTGDQRLTGTSKIAKSRGQIHGVTGNRVFVVSSAAGVTCNHLATGDANMDRQALSESPD
jgi:hypothetical protein